MFRDGIGFKTNPHEIDRGTFAAVMLRHMVELDTGKLTDSEYTKAVAAAAARLGLKLHSGQIDLSHKSAGTLSYIGSQIAEAVTVGRVGKSEAVRNADL